MAGPGGSRTPQRLLLLLLLGLIHIASSVFVVENSSNTTCIMANFSAAFSINYTTKSGVENASFTLPQSAKVLANSSSCGKENASNPILVIGFGEGYELTMNFTRTAKSYQVQLLSFTYNLLNTTLFPNASASSKEISVKSQTDIQADINKKYRCISGNQITMDNVTITLSEVTIQAYLSENNFSKEETRCRQDGPSPTSVSPTHPTTTLTPTPTKPSVPETPAVFKYNVSGANGTCLLGRMGLQLNITYENKVNMTVTRTHNINPNSTSVSGSCSPQVATLELHTENSTLVFTFGMNATTSKFFLHGIHFNTTFPDAKQPTFQAKNDSLKKLQATIGNSYKCNAEENVEVTGSFSVNIFSVRVQAFKIEGDKFGSVEECLLDENNMLIPIAVGGALAGLVLIVLIAYLIGRKRSHAGYQTI